MPASASLEKELGQKPIYLPLSYNYQEINRSLQRLAETLGIAFKPDPEAEKAAEAALAKAHETIGQTPIVIDYTCGPRPLSLARMLLEHDFNVTEVYADAFQVEEQQDFNILQQLRPELLLHPTEDVGMRVVDRTRPEKTLAIGQKAAYFTGSRYFVNIIEGGGMFGMDAVKRMADGMVAAFLTPKDTETLIQTKALDWGCNCTL